MADVEQQRESGTSLMFIGLAVMVAGLLVMFFAPAGFKTGRETEFVTLIAALGIAGLTLMVTGFVKRRAAGPEE